MLISEKFYKLDFQHYYTTIFKKKQISAEE